MIKYEACDKHQLNSSSKCCFILSFIPNKLTLIRVKLWVKLTGNMKSQNNLIFKILFWPKFPLFDSFTWQPEMWKHPSRFLWNYYNSAQDFMAIFQRRICGPIKYLWWRLSPLTIFEKKVLEGLNLNTPNKGWIITKLAISTKILAPILPCLNSPEFEERNIENIIMFLCDCNRISNKIIWEC